MAITPNTPNPVREDEYYEALAAKLGIPASAIPRTPVWRNEEELAALVQLFTNMQGSSGGGVLYVTASQDTGLDKNLEEIQTALDGGKVVMLKHETPSDGDIYFPLTRAVSYSDPEGPYYGVSFYNFSLGQVVSFSNTTGPTDPLVYEE